jgi:EmrB/QacA subfamily drug resistance transporter
MERKWLILTSVSLGSLMATLDGSIVNIALPAMQADLRVDLTTIEWVVVAYLLVVGSLLLPVGRLGEVLTFKRVYLVGFAVFTLASVCCGASPNVAALVVFRVAQAVGAAMIMAMGPAIVARTFSAKERGRALGLNGVSVSIGLSLGPILGGVLTQVATWRAIFLINAPIGLLAIAWAARVLPVETPGKGQSFDARGAALSGSALFALLLALSEGQQWGWTSPAVVGLLAAFVVLGAAFVLAERRSIQPMIDLACSGSDRSRRAWRAWSRPSPASSPRPSCCRSCCSRGEASRRSRPACCSLRCRSRWPSWRRSAGRPPIASAHGFWQASAWRSWSSAC